MPTLQPTRLRRTIAPGRHIDLLPAGAPGDPLRSPAVRIRREDGEGVVVYLPEVQRTISDEIIAIL